MSSSLNCLVSVSKIWKNLHRQQSLQAGSLWQLHNVIDLYDLYDIILNESKYLKFCYGI